MKYWISSQGITSSNNMVEKLTQGDKIGEGCASNKVYFISYGEVLAEEDLLHDMPQLTPAVLLFGIGTTVRANFCCDPPAIIGMYQYFIFL